MTEKDRIVQMLITKMHVFAEVKIVLSGQLITHLNELIKNVTNYVCVRVYIYFFFSFFKSVLLCINLMSNLTIFTTASCPPALVTE